MMIGEDQARGAVERARDDQQLVLEHEAHRHRREARVGVQQRDHRRHVGAADRDDQQHAEHEREHDDHREQERSASDRARDRRRAAIAIAEQRQVDHVLAAVGDRPGRDHLLELARRHQAAGEGEEAEQHLDHDRDRAERGELAVGEPDRVLRGADEPRGEAAERVRDRGPLRHGRERHARERDADRGADEHRDRDPAEVRRSPGGAACRRSRAPCRRRPRRRRGAPSSAGSASAARR